MKSNLDRNQVIQEYYDIYHIDTTIARNLIKKLDYKNDPNLLSEIATSYFDENKLRLAERYAIKAFQLDYLNPKTLWILALIKWDYGQFDAAIFNFQEIIRIGIKRVDKTGYGENKYIALSRINDSKFQLYRLLKDSKPAIAKKYLQQYEKGIEKGFKTLLKAYYDGKAPNQELSQ